MSWQAEYFSNQNFTGFILSRNEGSVIDVHTYDPASSYSTDPLWRGAPRETDGVAVRWTDVITAKYTETYTFYTKHDNTMRVLIDGVVKQSLGNGNGIGGNLHGFIDFAYSSFQMNLVAGQAYTIVYECGNHSWPSVPNPAIYRAEWQSPSQERELVTSGNSGKAPIRYVPASIAAMKAAHEQCFAWMLAIKPRKGAWEGYTSWDAPLDCPQYEDDLGNITPPILYQPNGAILSNIPTQLKLGAQSTDVTFHAPRRDAIIDSGTLPQLYLDRDKLLKKYYENAYWELFEVMPESDRVVRMLWQCGEIGGVSLDDLTATAELPTYEEIANRTTGEQLHVYCQVGSIRGEDFGTPGGRCRNALLNDGPLRNDWTVVATVVAGSSKRFIRVSIGSVAITGVPLHADFIGHLNNGSLEWFENEDGGPNNGFNTVLRGANLISTGGGFRTIEIYPKLSLPYVPEVGDKANLVVGCTRTKADCIFFDNLLNFRGQDLPGNDDLLKQTRL